MPYTKEQLNCIFDKTSGYCHICRKKLSFKNYGRFGAKGAWEVEHSIPKARGGTNRLSNIYASCISCNREKRDGSTRVARKQRGFTKAPLSALKRKKSKLANAIAGGTAGALIGSILGPLGTIVGAFIGGNAGHKQNPDKHQP